MFKLLTVYFFILFVILAAVFDMNSLTLFPAGAAIFCAGTAAIQDSIERNK